MDKIYFTLDSYTVDFDLRPPITIIRGNTGSGKSLFWQWFGDQKDLPENSAKYANIEFLNQRSDTSSIIGKTGKIFIIDNADILFRKHPEVVEHIALDRDNQYVIMCRRVYDLDVSPNHYAVVAENDNIFTLQYQSSVEGWY